MEDINKKKPKNIISNKDKCFLLYDDMNGMWHIPFFQYLCKTLEESYDLFVLLWNDLPQAHKLFPWANIIKIHKKSNKKLLHSYRMNQIEKLLNRIQPDIFLIDYFPFWRYGNILEISLICSFIKKNGWKNISFMRDLYLGKKILTWKSYDKFSETILNKRWKTISQLIENDFRYFFDIIFKWTIHHIFLIQSYLQYTISNNFIDGILIFGDKNIYDISNEFILSKAEKKIFHYVWYIPNNEKVLESIQPRKKTILISTWWNVTSEQDFLKLISYVNTLSWFTIRILLGPFVERWYKKKIISVVHNNKKITVSGFVDNFSSLLYESSYFFWFGWYWTFQSLFNYKGQAFIMSNYDAKDFKHRYYEQKYRTEHLKDYLNVCFLQDFSNENLESCLSYKAEKKKRKKIFFTSDSKIVDIIDTIKAK